MGFFRNRNKPTTAPEAPAARPAATPQAQPATQAPHAPNSLAGVKHVIAIASGKGGVGKSTVTVNLAVALRAMGATVGLLDADLYGPSQPGMIGAPTIKGMTAENGELIPAERNGVRFLSMGLFMQGDGPLVWRAPMAMKAIQQFLGNTQWGALDYLLIDLPPGTGDVQLTLAQQARLSGAVIVTTPQEVSLGIAKKGLEMFRNLNIPILGIVENMSGFTCDHCGHETAIFKEGGGQALAASLHVPFLGRLPLDPEIMMSGDNGVPVIEKDPSSPASMAVTALAHRLNEEIRASAQSDSAEEPRSFGLASPMELQAVWPDGHTSTYTPYGLRTHCGCASCVDENTGKPLLNPKNVPGDIRFETVQGVGRYALTARFSDGHGTGIYPFKKLRALCECPQCLGKREIPTPTPAPPAQKAQVAARPELAARVREVLDAQINPGVAGHGGRIELIEIRGRSAVMKMSGGCQGCGSAQATLKQGVEKTLRAQFPEIDEVIDITDHSAGLNPYLPRGQ